MVRNLFFQGDCDILVKVVLELIHLHNAMDYVRVDLLRELGILLVL